MVKKRVVHPTTLEFNKSLLFFLLMIAVYLQDTTAVLPSQSALKDWTFNLTKVDKNGKPGDLIAWNSIGINISTINGYKLWVRNEGKQIIYAVLDAYTTHIILSGLKPCLKYDFQLSPQLKNKESPGPIYNATSVPPSQVPPTVLRVSTDITARSLALSWERPSTACEITAYNITYSGEAKWEPRTEHTGSATIGRRDADGATSVVIDGLQPYTDYTVTVAAATEAGEGDSTYITTTTEQGVPSKPCRLRVSSPSPTIITASWREPVTYNGVLGDYNVRWYKDGVLEGEKNVSDTVHTIVDLLPSAVYTVRVAASTAGGVGQYAEIKHTTPWATSKLQRLLIINLTARNVSISWQRLTMQSEIIGYEITYSGVAKWGPRTEHTGSATIGRGDADGATSVVIDGLQPYTDYTVTVATFTAAGEVGRGNISTTTLEGTPSLPTELEVTSNSSSITASWREPQQHNGVLGDYNVTWYKDGKQEGSVLVTNCSYTITNLSPCVEYRVRVAATTEAGEGARAEKNKTTQAAPPVSSHLSCSPNSNTQTILVAWTKPNTSCTITNYELSWSNDTVTVDNSTLQNSLQHIMVPTASDKFSQICVAAVMMGQRGDRVCCDDLRPVTDENHQWGQYKITGIFVIAATLVFVVTLSVVIIKRNSIRGHLRSHENESSHSDVEDYYSDLVSKVKCQLEILLASEANLEVEFEQLAIDSFEAMKEVVPSTQLSGASNSDIITQGYRYLFRPINVTSESADFKAMFVSRPDYHAFNFIACHGPTEGAEADFWGMVWKENVHVIVMLEQCSTYWPLKLVTKKTLGVFTTQMEALNARPSYIMREIKLEKDGEVKSLKHFRLNDSLEFKVTKSEKELLELIKEVRQLEDPNPTNVLVHCSSGVGRTGTLIALWQLELDVEARVPEIGVRQTVLALRRCRKIFVQDQSQYLFLHSCFELFLRERNQYSQQTEGPPESRRSHRRRAEIQLSAGEPGTAAERMALLRPTRPMPLVPDTSTSEAIALVDVAPSKEEPSMDHSYYYPKITDKVKGEIREGGRETLVIVQTVVSKV